MTEQNPDLRIPEPVPDPKPDEAPAPDAAATPDPAAQSGEQTFVNAGLPRIPAHFTRSQKLLAFCCPLAGFGVLRYMILHALGLPATLVCWGVLTLGILFLKRTPRIRFTWSHRCMAAVLYLFPLLFCISDNKTMTGLCALYELAGIPFFFYHVASGEAALPRCLPLALYKALLDYPGQNNLMFPAIRQCLQKRKLSRNALYVLGGLLLGLPLSLLVYAMLLSVDQNMGVLTDWIRADWYRNLMIYLVQLLLGLPIGMFLYNSLYNNATRRNIRSLRQSDCTRILEGMRIAPGMLLYAIMTPVCFVYAVYIGLQASYLFSGFAGTLPKGFSYASYARSGFFELCFLSVLNFLLIALLFLACRRQGDAPPADLQRHPVRHHLAANRHIGKQNVPVHLGNGSDPQAGVYCLVHAVSGTGVPDAAAPAVPPPVPSGTGRAGDGHPDAGSAGILPAGRLDRSLQSERIQSWKAAPAAHFGFFGSVRRCLSVVSGLPAAAGGNESLRLRDSSDTPVGKGCAGSLPAV